MLRGFSRRNVILSKYEEMNLDRNVVLREEIIKPAEEEENTIVLSEMKSFLFASSSSRQRVIDTHFQAWLVVAWSSSFVIEEKHQFVDLELLLLRAQA